MNFKNDIPLLALVVPCYNEEEVLGETYTQLKNVMEQLKATQRIKNESYLLFVDDGSKDDTWHIIQTLSIEDSYIKGIKLSKNEGHQNALLAGMQFVQDKCDCLISLDADLQDDVDAIKKMIEEYINGSEVVFGVRDDRSADTFTKKVTAEFYYRLMRFLGVDLLFNHADYRLLSSKALNFFLEFKERNLFIRGIVKKVGLKNSVVYYQRKERFAGESKYPFRKMFSFAWNGITSFSTVPLKLITFVGLIVSILSICMGIWAIALKLFTDNTIPGWSSTVLPIYFIGGVQLLSVGILGEYIGKIYEETKQRPYYFIEEEIN